MVTLPFGGEDVDVIGEVWRGVVDSEKVVGERVAEVSVSVVSVIVVGEDVRVIVKVC